MKNMAEGLFTVAVYGSMNTCGYTTEENPSVPGSISCCLLIVSAEYFSDIFFILKFIICIWRLYTKNTNFFLSSFTYFHCCWLHSDVFGIFRMCVCVFVYLCVCVEVKLMLMSSL